MTGTEARRFQDALGGLRAAKSRSPTVVVLQGKLPHYRVPFFRTLGSAVRLRVVHAGRMATANDAGFEERSEPALRIGSLRWQTRIASHIADADVVVAMFDPHWLANVRLAFMRSRPALVYWGIGFGGGGAGNRLRLMMARRADAIVLYGESAREAFVAGGVSGSRIFVAPNSIEAPVAGDRGLDVPQEFVFLGSLEARKELRDALEAFATIQHRIPREVVFSIIGDGPERDRLKSVVEELGLKDRVVFHGAISDPSIVARHLSRSLAMVTPGQAGLAVLQCFASGVPVVTRRTAISGGEIDNVIDGVTGILYDGTVSELAERMATIANHPVLAQTMGAAAREHYVEKRTMRHMAEGFLDAIEFALSSHGAYPSQSDLTSGR